MRAMPRFSSYIIPGSYIITGIVAGLVAIHPFEFPHGPWSTGQVPLHATQAAPDAPLSNPDVLDVDLSRTGDRISLPQVANPEVTVSVSSVEFTDGSVLYRDRSGRLLFRTDPVTNTMIILKDVVVPKSIVRHTAGVPARTKIFGIDQGKPVSAPLVGCEALANSLADPTLSRLIGRCFA